jgi:hypothetical protein
VLDCLVLPVGPRLEPMAALLAPQARRRITPTLVVAGPVAVARQALPRSQEPMLFLVAVVAAAAGVVAGLVFIEIAALVAALIWLVVPVLLAPVLGRLEPQARMQSEPDVALAAAEARLPAGPRMAAPEALVALQVEAAGVVARRHRACLLAAQAVQALAVKSGLSPI